jgi:chromosome segregation ATPase
VQILTQKALQRKLEHVEDETREAKTRSEEMAKDKLRLRDSLHTCNNDLTAKANELRVMQLRLTQAHEDIGELETQIQQLAQMGGSLDAHTLPLSHTHTSPPSASDPAARDVGGARARAVDNDKCADMGPAQPVAAMPKGAGLGFTFKRDSRTGCWQVSPKPLTLNP